MTMAAHCTVCQEFYIAVNVTSLCFAIQLLARILLTTTVAVTGGIMLVSSVHSTHLLHPGSGDHW